MKKKVGIAIAAVVCAIVLGLGIYKTDASQQNPKLSVDDIRQMIEAQYPGDITEIELEKDKNKSVYEVEVVSQGREYELKLDGQTGEILNLKERTKRAKENMVLNDKPQAKEEATTNSDDSTEKAIEKSQQDDRHHQKDVKQSQNASGQSLNKKKPEEKNNEAPAQQEKKPNNQATVIDINQAVAIAKSQFNGKVIEAELDKDDGRLIYEIEMENGQEEAEFEIDAYTGEILVIEIDRDDD